MSAPDSPWRLCVAPMMDWTDRHCRYFHRRRLVLSERGLTAGTIEYKGRTQAAAENAPLAGALRLLQDKFAAA